METPAKTADILRPPRFPCEMKCKERLRKFHTDSIARSTMEDKNPWNGYGKPSFDILNLSNVQM